MEFTVDPVTTFSNMNNRQSAIRIKHLVPGTVKFETLIEQGARGVVTKDAVMYSSSSSSSSPTRSPAVSFAIIASQLYNCYGIVVLKNLLIMDTINV